VKLGNILTEALETEGMDEMEGEERLVDATGRKDPRFWNEVWK
jgi:hypothetical protein